jgi:hypothetical protein
MIDQHGSNITIIVHDTIEIVRPIFIPGVLISVSWFTEIEAGLRVLALVASIALTCWNLYEKHKNRKKKKATDK